MPKLASWLAESSKNGTSRLVWNTDSYDLDSKENKRRKILMENKRGTEDKVLPEKSGYEILRHIQFWDQDKPSRTDLLLTLELVLELLAEALPIAMEFVGQKSVPIQEIFWRSYIAFDREADLGYHGETISGDLDGWAEVCRLRSNNEEEGPV